MTSASANAPSTANARLAAAGLTATTILLLTAGLSMLQPLSTDLYLSTLPGIATYFNASVASVQSTLWMFIAAFGIWQLIAGPLSDRFGRYPIVVAGAFTFCAASVLAMIAPSLEVLLRRSRAASGGSMYVPGRCARICTRFVLTHRGRADDREGRNHHESRSTDRPADRRDVVRAVWLAFVVRSARDILAAARCARHPQAKRDEYTPQSKCANARSDASHVCERGTLIGHFARTRCQQQQPMRACLLFCPAHHLFLSTFLARHRPSSRFRSQQWSSVTWSAP